MRPTLVASALLVVVTAAATTVAVTLKEAGKDNAARRDVALTALAPSFGSLPSEPIVDGTYIFPIRNDGPAAVVIRSVAWAGSTAHAVDKPAAPGTSRYVSVPFGTCPASRVTYGFETVDVVVVARGKPVHRRLELALPDKPREQLNDDCGLSK